MRLVGRPGLRDLVPPGRGAAVRARRGLRHRAGRRTARRLCRLHAGPAHRLPAGPGAPLWRRAFTARACDRPLPAASLGRARRGAAPQRPSRRGRSCSAA
ncbi:MAG: hypothetical protein MZW92_35190 [Comamonadaceae bacterium]|nr:hypothetical protein [Comamonadaceae bacterium]